MAGRHVIYDIGGAYFDEIGINRRPLGHSFVVIPAGGDVEVGLVLEAFIFTDELWPLCQALTLNSARFVPTPVA